MGQLHTNGSVSEREGWMDAKVLVTIEDTGRYSLTSRGSCSISESPLAPSASHHGIERATFNIYETRVEAGPVSLIEVKQLAHTHEISSIMVG